METKDYFKNKEWCIYKEENHHRTKWVDLIDVLGEHWFTFDEVTFYNLFADYPHNLNVEEKEIFDKENPYWADFFKHRST